MKHFFLLLFVFFPLCASATDKHIELPYGVATTVDFCLPDDLDATNLIGTATFAAGDVTIMKDEGAETNIGTLPTDEGTCYSVPLTATELEAARANILIIDQTATRIWADTVISIQTCGHPDSANPGGCDLPAFTGTATAGSTTTTTIENIAALTGTDELAGYSIKIVGGAGSGQFATITQYNSTTEVVTHTTLHTATASGSKYIIELDKRQNLEIDANGYVSTNVKAISDDTTAPGNLELDYDGTGYAKANSTMGTVTTLTGHTAQTGDSYARLGAPAGASVSADVADIKLDSAAILSAARVAVGTCDSGSTTTCVDAALTEADADYWAKGVMFQSTSGTTAGQQACVYAFTPGSDTLTFRPALTQAIATNNYALLTAPGCAGVVAP